MPEFSCRVATGAGEVFEKNYMASDANALRRELEGQDLMILNLRQRNPFARQLLRMFRLGGSVSSREFLFFNQELRALLRAGLPIVPSLDILLERRKNKTFKKTLIDVRDRVRGGESLSEAFGAQGELFPPLYAASLASGERSGEMVAVLERFVTYMQKVLSLRRKVSSAMIYPIILTTLLTILILVMVLFIIPSFEQFLSEFGTELPWLTKMVVGVSMFATKHWLVLSVGTFVTVVGLTWWKRTEAGREAFDRLVLSLPLAGRVMHNYAQNRFTRTLGTLQAGGIPLVMSLELSAKALGNVVFEKALLDVTEQVREGQTLWESLDRTELMSDMTIQMVKVGESTGALDEMLDNASDFTDEEIDDQLTRLVAMVEPIMLVVMAVVVGVMLMSIYYPLVQVYGQAAV